MSDESQEPSQTRRQPRLKIAARYTLLRVRKQGDSRYRWTGYIYDVSNSGMRFELDKPLDPGVEIEVRGMLPGQQHITFRAHGRVVRMHDEDETGPYRMGMTLTKFHTEIDRKRLEDYLQYRGLRAA